MTTPPRAIGYNGSFTTTRRDFIAHSNKNRFPRGAKIDDVFLANNAIIFSFTLKLFPARGVYRQPQNIFYNMLYTYIIYNVHLIETLKFSALEFEGTI